MDSVHIEHVSLVRGSKVRVCVGGGARVGVCVCVGVCAGCTSLYMPYSGYSGSFSRH